MRTLIIVPAFNEAPVLSKTLLQIKNSSINRADIIVVDDGSLDDTYQIARQHSVGVLRHVLNRGLGGAIGTGLEYAKRNDYDLAVTIDSDGQHKPSDIINVVKPIIKGRADVVIGSRFLKKTNKIPLDRRLLLTLSNWFTYFLFGIITTDSQSGFRAFGKKALNHVSIRTERMEVSSELFGEIRRLKLKLAEVPIKVIYTHYSRTKGQSNLNAMSVAYKLLLRLFR